MYLPTSDIFQKVNLLKSSNVAYLNGTSDNNPEKIFKIKQ